MSAHQNLRACQGERPSLAQYYVFAASLSASLRSLPVATRVT